MTIRRTASRPLYEIAEDIRRNWDNVYFGAVPYLEAMFALDSMDDMYGMDDARSIVAYFLSNATTWRGEDARRIKAELNSMLKTGSKKTAGVFLTDVALENAWGDLSQGAVGRGIDPNGNEVRFRLSPEDAADLRSIMVSDLAMNFSGVTVDESDIISEARRKTASRVANSGDDFTDSTKTAYTLTEWSVSVTSPNRWMSTPGVWDGAPNAILNVHKTVDEPNEFGGIGKSVKHPEYDGLTFDSVDEAWAFAESKGLVSKRGSKTAEYDWDSNPQGRDREHYFCAECGVEGTYENQLRLLPSGRRVCRNCEVYRGVKAKRKPVTGSRKTAGLPTYPPGTAPARDQASLDAAQVGQRYEYTALDSDGWAGVREGELRSKDYAGTGQWWFTNILEMFFPDENMLRADPVGTHTAKRKTAADVWVGGGDDWVPLDYAQKDHEPDVGDFIGTMSTCRICKGTVIRDQDASGRYIDRWVHVQAEKATRRHALNEQSGYAESDLDDVEVDDDNADEEPMFPWEIKESPEEVREAGLNVWAQNGVDNPGGESDPPHVEVTDPQAQESMFDEGWAEQGTPWESATISDTDTEGTIIEFASRKESSVIPEICLVCGLPGTHINSNQWSMWYLCDVHADEARGQGENPRPLRAEGFKKAAITEIERSDDFPVDEWNCDNCGDLIGWVLNEDLDRAALDWYDAFQDGSQRICEACAYDRAGDSIWTGGAKKQANSADYQAGFAAGTQDAKTQPTVNTPGANMVPYGHSLPEGASSDFQKGYHEGYQSATQVMMGKRKTAQWIQVDDGWYADSMVHPNYYAVVIDFEGQFVWTVFHVDESSEDNREVARGTAPDLAGAKQEARAAMEGIALGRKRKTAWTAPKSEYSGACADGDHDACRMDHLPDDICLCTHSSHGVNAPRGFSPDAYNDMSGACADGDHAACQMTHADISAYCLCPQHREGSGTFGRRKKAKTAQWVEQIDPWGLSVFTAGEAQVWPNDEGWQWKAGSVEGAASTLEEAQAKALAQLS